MKRVGLMAVMLIALILESCDLLKTKEIMDTVSREMIKDPDENDPDGG